MMISDEMGPHEGAEMRSGSSEPNERVNEVRSVSADGVPENWLQTITL